MPTSDQRSGYQREIRALTERIAQLKAERDEWVDEALAVGIEQDAIDRWCDI